MAQVILYTLMGVYSLGIITTIGSIGKPRGPVTNRVAVIVTIYGVAAIYGLVYVTGGLK